MKFIATADRGDEKQVANKLRDEWIKFVIVSTHADFKDAFEDEDLSILDKAQVRKTLEQNAMSVIDNYDGSVDIYVGEDCIGHWDKPYFKIHTGLNKRSPIFVEIELSCWSVFDEEE